MHGHQHDFTLHVKGDDCIEFREWNKFLRREFLREFLSRVLIFADREKKSPAKIRTRKNLVPHGRDICI